MAETGVMHLRIESDGTAGGTRVKDVQSGKVLPVSAVTWTMDMREGTEHRGLATATITVPVFVQLDAVAVAHLSVDALRITATSAVPSRDS